jgi:hypothetical protein
LSDVALVERIGANEWERRRLDAELAAALTIADLGGVKEIDGHRTMASFWRAEVNWSTTEAGRRLGLATAVDQIDGFGAAWCDGRFGLAQATQFSKLHGNRRVRPRLAEFAPILLEHADQPPCSDFAKVVDHFVDHFVANADVDGAHDERDLAIEGRRARVTDVGGLLDIRRPAVTDSRPPR